MFLESVHLEPSTTVSPRETRHWLLINDISPQSAQFYLYVHDNSSSVLLQPFQTRKANRIQIPNLFTLHGTEREDVLLSLTRENLHACGGSCDTTEQKMCRKYILEKYGCLVSFFSFFPRFGTSNSTVSISRKYKEARSPLPLFPPKILQFGQ
jgi:hypothetical protein